MNDPILKEIRRSLSNSTPENWFSTPQTPGGECQIYSTLPSGGTKRVGTAYCEADAHLIAHAKDYITHLLALLERKNDSR